MKSNLKVFIHFGTYKIVEQFVELFAKLGKVKHHQGIFIVKRDDYTSLKSKQTISDTY